MSRPHQPAGSAGTLEAIEHVAVDGSQRDDERRSGGKDNISGYRGAELRQQRVPVHGLVPRNHVRQFDRASLPGLECRVFNFGYSYVHI
jgi:hypothetical protein